MDFFDVIKSRHSVRNYADRPIENFKLEQLLHSVNAAPSAGDLQSYEIVIMRDPEHKQALAKAAHNQGFIADAPLVLVFCANAEQAQEKYGSRGAKLFCVQDATIAASYAQLSAVALGLSSAWVGAFNEAAVTRLVGGLKPVCILPIGYAAETPGPSPRRSLDDLIHEEHL